MIGVFDSGFGGLTVLRGLLDEMPSFSYIYLGDNARAPYGSKSQTSILNYTKEAIDFLFSKGCRLIVIACNTASAKALAELEKEYLPKNYPDRKVWGVLCPVAEEIAQLTKNNPRKNKIGIIGTRATINSNAYEQEILKINNQVKIFSQACPLLVPLVEEGWVRRREAKMILRYYLRGLKKEKINYLILGCTHYPIFKKEIFGIMGDKCLLLDSPSVVASRLSSFLNSDPEFKKELQQKADVTFYTTDDPDKFKDLGSRFLGKSISGVNKVSLGK